jgi:hypothetical protein
MPLAKPPRRKVSPSSSLSEHSLSSARAAVSPTPRHHHVTKVPLAVSVTAFLAVIAVIIGTMAASSMQRDDDMLRADLERVQQDLSDRVTRLEDAMMRTSQPSPEPKPAPSSTSAALPVTVTAQQLNEMRAQVAMASWDMSTSTEMVEYRDTQRGVRFTVPYHPKWGNNLYKVAPFEIEESGRIISFGPLLRQVNSGYFYRKYRITIVPSSETINRNGGAVSARRLGAFDTTSVTTTEGEGSLIFNGKKYTYILNEIEGTSKDAGLLYQPIPMSDSAALSLLRTLRSI